MLRRIGQPGPESGGGRRLWFNSPDMDLVVVLDDRDDLSRFQLSWDKGRDERSLSWDRLSGFSHGRVLDGEDRLRATETKQAISLR